MHLYHVQPSDDGMVMVQNYGHRGAGGHLPQPTRTAVPDAVTKKLAALSCTSCNQYKTELEAPKAQHAKCGTVPHAQSEMLKQAVADEQPPKTPAKMRPKERSKKTKPGSAKRASVKKPSANKEEDILALRSNHATTLRGVFNRTSYGAPFRRTR